MVRQQSPPHLLFETYVRPESDFYEEESEMALALEHTGQGLGPKLGGQAMAIQASKYKLPWLAASKH